MRRTKKSYYKNKDNKYYEKLGKIKKQIRHFFVEEVKRLHGKDFKKNNVR